MIVGHCAGGGVYGVIVSVSPTHFSVFVFPFIWCVEDIQVVFGFFSEEIVLYVAVNGVHGGEVRIFLSCHLGSKPSTIQWKFKDKVVWK